jgi:acyl-CoA reductase-like NAD-dependent aldehyde dehydrogenase
MTMALITASERPQLRADVQEFVAREQGHLIGGAPTPSASGRTFETADPSTAERLAVLAHGDAADVDVAVRAARQALTGDWAAVSPAECGRLIGRLADLIAEHADELAELESLDNGKPVQFAKAVDLDLTIGHRYFAGWPSKLTGETVPVSVPGEFCYTLKEPVGVCGQIVPWNYPLLMAAWKVAPALAAGCTIVLKPAEETPLTVIRLGELALEAGIPPGVLNVLLGDGETGAALVDHPDVDKIAFTGSTEVGRKIGAKAGGALKRVTLELGGKSPNIILPDADLDVAVPGSFLALYFNSGQSCTRVRGCWCIRASTARSSTAWPRWHRTLTSAPGWPATSSWARSSRSGSSSAFSATSTLASPRARTSSSAAGRSTGPVTSWSRRCSRQRTTTSRSGARRSSGRCSWRPPTTRSTSWRTARTTLSTGSGVWTRDLSSAHKLARSLKAGSIYINQWAPNDAAAPFGGYKASGLGREHGRLGLESYLEHKTVWIQLG